MSDPRTDSPANSPAGPPAGPPARPAMPTVQQQLAAEAYRFDFYQVVNLIETMRPDAAPVGVGAMPAQEPLRFVHVPSQAFPASDVLSVSPPEEEGGQYQVSTSFLGLSGAHGPLPPPYSQLLLERNSRRDRGMKDFLGIFEHRLVALLYQIRRRHRTGFERTPPHRTATARYLFSLIGLGTPGLRDRMAVADHSLLQHAGMLTHRPRSLAALCSLVSAIFGVPVTGRKLIGAWQTVDARDRTTLGRNGRNNRLGRDVMAGTRVWQQDSRVRLVLGPLTGDQVARFLPDGDGFAALCELGHFCIGDRALDLEIELQPTQDALPPPMLSSRTGARLGWTSQLRTRSGSEGGSGGGSGDAEGRNGRGILFGPSWTGTGAL
ncbi:type VI secretion system baseplate subunit TssG [Azospirillum sp. HJ39]|uniref:type VI secretion system baseplate subunit TssG n=1 Tax=Azospirillum sp. HJ39 TaxID=3159496 RepID=UPI0035582890